MYCRSLYDREAKSLRELQKAFCTAVKTAVKKKGAGSPFRVLKYLNSIDQQHHEATILLPIEKRKDSVQFALDGSCTKLFILLLAKIDAKVYLNSNKLLEKAICEGNETMVKAVLLAHERNDVEVFLSTFNERTKRRLYDGSWSQAVIQKLYPHTSSFFIPRGQAKAKMMALVYYNTFEISENSRHEIQKITKGLVDYGFTVQKPLIDWTVERLKKELRCQLKEIEDQASLILICLHTEGVFSKISDTEGHSMETDELLEELDCIKTPVPVVCIK